MGGGVIDMADTICRRHAHAPFGVFPAPAGEGGIERFSREDIAANQQIGGEDVFFRKLTAFCRAEAVALAGHCLVDGEGFRIRRL